MSKAKLIPVTMRHCRDCGRFIPVRNGVPDPHETNGRGEPCLKKVTYQRAEDVGRYGRSWEVVR